MLAEEPELELLLLSEAQFGKSKFTLFSDFGVVEGLPGGLLSDGIIDQSVAVSPVLCIGMKLPRRSASKQDVRAEVMVQGLKFLPCELEDLTSPFRTDACKANYEDMHL